MESSLSFEPSTETTLNSLRIRGITVLQIAGSVGSWALFEHICNAANLNLIGQNFLGLVAAVTTSLVEWLWQLATPNIAKVLDQLSETVIRI
jgi:fucose permease